MRIYHFVCCGIIFCLFLTSCTKDMSHETFREVFPTDQDCSITKVTPCDSISGKGYGSFQISTTANQLSASTMWYDSTTASVNYQATFSYQKDTMRVSPDIYFLLDDSGRIRALHTLENPLDTGSDRHIFTYIYNAGGQLINKTWLHSTINADIPLFSYQYAWQNGNLISVEVREAEGNKRRVMYAELHYDLSKTVHDFLYFFPDAHELAPYIFSVNVGKKSNNLLEKIVLRLFDDNGSELQSYVTVYKRYEFTANGNVSAVFASGDALDGLPLVNGLTRFEYDCK